MGALPLVIEDKTWQVKLIKVKPREELSLQMHHQRSEHWVVVSGIAKVEIGNKVNALYNQSVYIPLGTKHRLSNPEYIFNTNRSSKWNYLEKMILLDLKINMGGIFNFFKKKLYQD